MKHLGRLTVAGVLLLGMISGCSSSNQSSSPSSASTSGGGKLIVFAAASLKKSFTDIGEQFKTDNPGTDIEFSFAGSSDLVT